MPALAATHHGVGPVSFRSTTTRFQRTDIDNTGPAFSVIAIYRPLDNTLPYNTFVGNGSAGGSKGWKVGVDYNGTTNYQQIATFGGVADYIVENTTWTTVGQTRIVGFRVSGNGGTYSAYQNGALIGTSAVGTMLTPPGAPYTIGAYYAGSYAGEPIGTIPLVAFFNRAMGDAQMRELTENPWAIYSPRRVIVPGAAIVGVPSSSFKSAWARNSNVVIQ